MWFASTQLQGHLGTLIYDLWHCWGSRQCSMILYLWHQKWIRGFWNKLMSSGTLAWFRHKCAYDIYYWACYNVLYYAGKLSWIKKFIFMGKVGLEAWWRRGSWLSLVHMIVSCLGTPSHYWTNVELPSVTSFGIHSRVMFTWVLKISIPKFGIKSTHRAVYIISTTYPNDNRFVTWAGGLRGFYSFK